MNLRLLFSLSFLLSLGVISNAVSCSPEVLHPKLTNHHPLLFNAFSDDAVCPIIAIVSDLTESKKFLEPISCQLLADNPDIWRITTKVKKNQLLAILDLPWVISVELVKALDLN